MQHVLTVEETAELLRVNTDTILRWIKRGELNAVKLGNKYLITPQEINRYYQAKGGTGELLTPND